MYSRQNLRTGEVLDERHIDPMEEELYQGSLHIDTGHPGNEIHGLRIFGDRVQVDTDLGWADVRMNPTVYGISIDLSNSNPETAVTYTDDAVGMIPGTDWLTKPIFNRIKPCLFKEGKVVGYLNPDNFAQFENGTPADITSGEAGDVMIEIPKIGYKISKSDTTLTVQITDSPNKEGFAYKAHTRTFEGDRDKLYVGAFLGSGEVRLRSISGVTPLGTRDLSSPRILAQNNGLGYDLLSFYPLTLIQCLYMIMYKNLDSQTALGRGYVGVKGTNYPVKETGATISKGMNYGSSDYTEQMKFLGMEDLWGNLTQWVEGLITNSTLNALVATTGFNDAGDGYVDLGKMYHRTLAGYMVAPKGTNELGFIIATEGGSSSTYFSDYPSLYPSKATNFGGGRGSADSAGVFRLCVKPDPFNNTDDIGSRLMYL